VCFLNRTDRAGSSYVGYESRPDLDHHESRPFPRHPLQISPVSVILFKGGTGARLPFCIKEETEEPHVTLFLFPEKLKCLELMLYE